MFFWWVLLEPIFEMNMLPTGRDIQDEGILIFKMELGELGWGGVDWIDVALRIGTSGELL
jgi:hypothetical protein